MKRREFVKVLGSATATPFLGEQSASSAQTTVTQSQIRIVTTDEVSKTVYDAIVVGAGVAGAVVAKQLGNAGKTVLMLEAGTAEGLTPDGFQSFLERYYTAVTKNSNCPYPPNPNALSPTDGSNGYFEEQGKLPISGSYTRIVGGTTMHWEGKTLRMLPEDFQLRTKFGVGLDWPLRYEDLIPYYQQAELEIGVAGDVDEQRELGVPFPDSYRFPMKKIPPSFLDEVVRKRIDGTKLELDGADFELRLTTFPQGRNGQANPGFSGPTGVACQGNASCVPICPYQAKYDARRTLNQISSPTHVQLLPQAVASDVQIDHENGRVIGIVYKRYRDKNLPDHIVGTARGKLYVLAANAIENARLMLASRLTGPRDLVGRNLMDHPFILAWGLMPELVGAMRGPLVTSGIGAFRKGSFRSKQAAFSIDVHNDGWGWAGIGPNDILRDAVDIRGKYGAALRAELLGRISRQILLAFMCEMPADPANRISLDQRYKDQLGNLRPAIQYDLPDYAKRTMAYARDISKRLFDLLQVKDFTQFNESDPAYFEYNGRGYWFRGGNHFAGTHIMGTSRGNSVVDSHLRCWDHDNLYLLGAGAMPSIGTANTTLTIAALSFRAAEQMLRDLQK